MDYPEIDMTEISTNSPEETNKGIFKYLVKKYIHREGIKDLMDYLERSDFYEAPCSTKYHLSCRGGLCQHSINVFYALIENSNFIESEHITDETIAIVSMFHDLCKIRCYKPSLKWQKNSKDEWEQVPYYSYDEDYPFGHGEKSAIIVQRYLKVSNYELQAINAHMGFSDIRGAQLIGNIFKKNKLAVALHLADMTATYFLEE